MVLQALEWKWPSISSKICSIVSNHKYLASSASSTVEKNSGKGFQLYPWFDLKAKSFHFLLVIDLDCLIIWQLRNFTVHTTRLYACMHTTPCSWLIALFVIKRCEYNKNSVLHPSCKVHIMYLIKCILDCAENICIKQRVSYFDWILLSCIHFIWFQLAVVSSSSFSSPRWIEIQHGQI